MFNLTYFLLLLTLDPNLSFATVKYKQAMISLQGVTGFEVCNSGIGLDLRGSPNLPTVLALLFCELPISRTTHETASSMFMLFLLRPPQNDDHDVTMHAVCFLLRERV